GYAAAIAAARAGADCILVERLDQLGGTSTAAYVSVWGPGAAGSFAREIYNRLQEIPYAVGIARDHNPDRKQGPFGLWLVTEGLPYQETLRGAAAPRSKRRSVVFEPDALGRVVVEMLAETGNCRTLLETTFTEVETDGPRIQSIRAETRDGRTYRIRARVFIDATGGVHVCRAAGYETMLGPESKDRFNESLAPDKPGKTLNAVSLCYRIRKSTHPKRQPPPDPPVKKWPRSAHVSGQPNGDRIVNPLALLPGRTVIDLSRDDAMARAERIVQAQWRWLQTYPAFSQYEFESYAPMLGVRETYRVVGEYVLTQHDLQAGLDAQPHPDIIAVANHSMDVHGAGSRRVRGEVKQPYGVHYRCLVPKGSVNLLAACRGASFSHIAASSCRLSRTIIQLGRAAGLAAAMAAENDVPVTELDVAALRQKLDVKVPGK
ncbi:MAG: FAD-dependent oxidoreductase, partial [Planctomycetes bacterium]|nr:FAD-dependent oxidoreductase [Planctomycetota bacterium]